MAILSILQVPLTYVLFGRPPKLTPAPVMPTPLMLVSLLLAGVGWLLGTHLLMETKNR
jgi:hypothetical protein